MIKLSVLSSPSALLPEALQPPSGVQQAALFSPFLTGTEHKSVFFDVLYMSVQVLYDSTVLTYCPDVQVVYVSTALVLKYRKDTLTFFFCTQESC